MCSIDCIIRTNKKIKIQQTHWQNYKIADSTDGNGDKVCQGMCNQGMHRSKQV